jgi:hypothetical protein
MSTRLKPDMIVTVRGLPGEFRLCRTQGRTQWWAYSCSTGLGWVLDNDAIIVSVSNRPAEGFTSRSGGWDANGSPV